MTQKEFDNMYPVVPPYEASLGICTVIDRNLDSLKDRHKEERIRDGKVNGYYDSETRTVHLYGPGLKNANKYQIANKTTYILLETVGLKGMLGEKYKEFEQNYRDSLKGETCLRETVTPETEGMYMPDKLDLRDNNIFWKLLTNAFTDITGVEGNNILTETIIRGIRHHEINTLRTARENKDYTTLSDMIAGEMKYPENQVLRFGNISDAYKSLEYEQKEIIIPIEKMKTLLEKMHLKEDFISKTNLVKAVQEPLYIKGSSRGNFKAVIDVKDKYGEDRYFYVFLDRPEAPYRDIIIRGMAPCSKLGMLSDLGRGKRIKEYYPEELLYLRESFNGIRKEYDVLKHLERMKDKSLNELTKGSTRGLAKPVNPLRVMESALRNIKEFKPYLGKKGIEKLFRENFNKQENEKQSIIRQGSLSERMKTKIDSGLIKTKFSDRTKQKLAQNGLLTAKDIMSIGDKRLEAILGPKGLRDCKSFLKELRLSNRGKASSYSYDVVTVRTPLSQMSKEEARGYMIKDFRKALAGVDENWRENRHIMPTGIYGNMVNREAVIPLSARMDYVRRWNGCNIFLEGKDAEELGFTLKDNVIRNFVPLKGTELFAYEYVNLAETSFRESPLFLDVVERMADRTKPLPERIGNLIPMIKDIPEDMAEKYIGIISDSMYEQLKEEALEEQGPTLREVIKEVYEEQVLGRKAGHNHPISVFADINAPIFNNSWEEIGEESFRRGCNIDDVIDLAETLKISGEATRDLFDGFMKTLSKTPKL